MNKVHLPNAAKMWNFCTQFIDIAVDVNETKYFFILYFTIHCHIIINHPIGDH